MIGAMSDTRGRGTGGTGDERGGMRDAESRNQDPPGSWRAGCIERCLSGSGRGRRKRAERYLACVLLYATSLKADGATISTSVQVPRLFVRRQPAALELVG